MTLSNYKHCFVTNNQRKYRLSPLQSKIFTITKYNTNCNYLKKKCVSVLWFGCFPSCSTNLNATYKAVEITNLEIFHKNIHQLELLILEVLIQFLFYLFFFLFIIYLPNSRYVLSVSTSPLWVFLGCS